MGRWEGNLDAVPRIERDAVRLLWHVDYWDGPLSGVCILRGTRHWFQMLDEDEVLTQRRFVVLRLSAAQLADEEEIHARFERYVGTHTTYDDAGRRAGSARDRSDWSRFYDWYKQRAPRDYSRNEAVAWWIW
jgi:hypothetical protein